MDQTNWLVLVVMAIFLISICNGYRKGFFRLCVSLAATILTVILVGILTPYVGEAIMKWTTVDEAVQEKCMEIFTPAEISEKENVSLQEQIQTIEQAELPEFFKQILLENNNREIYEILGVEQFADYISGYITRTAINVMAFLVTFVLITIVVRMTLFTLDVITKIPILHGLNRWAGAALGLVMGVILVWIFFLVITLLGGTAFGAECFRQIQSSRFLSGLYKANVILKEMLF